MISSNTSYRKRNRVHEIPSQLYDLDLPADVLIRIANLVDFFKEAKHSSYEKIIINNLLIILNTNDLAISQRLNVCFFVHTLYPIQ
jgi:hypothetical protein